MKNTLFAVAVLSALAASAVETFRLPFAAPTLKNWTAGWGKVNRTYSPENVSVTVNGKFYAEFEVAEAGPHTVWISYSTDADKQANAAVKIMNAVTMETIRWERYDYKHCLLGEKFWEEPKTFKRPARSDFYAFDVNFEQPGKYILCIEGFAATKARGSCLQTKEVWITNEPRFRAYDDTGKRKWSHYNRPSVPTNAPVAAAASPAGFEPARVHPIHTRLNTGIEDKKRCFFGVLHQNYHVYGSEGANVELANMGFMGFSAGNVDSGLLTGAGVKRGGKTFEEAYSNNVKVVKDVLADPKENAKVVQWDISWEGAAPFHWGRTNVWPRYRGWLKDKYGTLAKLNAAWRTGYKSFDEIEPPKSRAQVLGKAAEADPTLRGQLKANFIDYRAACADWHANEMKARALAAHDADPERRRITAAFSNLDLNSVTFSAWRASDFDVIIKNMADAKATHFGYDAYAADDFIGMEIDEFSAFSDDRLIINCSETSTHTPDPTLAVRSYWTGIGKRLGMWATFQHQEQGWNVEFPKFGNTDSRQTPRPKLAAFSDAVRQVHHIEDVYVDSRKAYPTKPVAIYYSRTCNALQERGYGSIFDCGPDSVFRVYELLRANGYVVTFISDRQFLDGSGRLDKIGALVFVDAKYVPAAVIDKVADWVKRGGHVFADAKPGLYDEHGYEQDRLAPLLGIRPCGGKFPAYAPDDLHTTEFVATDGKALMFSGFGREHVEPADPSVRIALRDPKGEPVFLTKADGRGSWAYLAGYLGSIFGAAPDQYGWRDGHADASPYRFVRAWLKDAGVEPAIDIAALDPYVSRTLRFECPLVDTKGNMLLNVENYSFLTCPGGKVAWKLPSNAKTPSKVLFLKAKTRKAEELDFTCADGKLELTLPPFGPYAVVMALADAPSPILSVELDGLEVSSQAQAELPVVPTNGVFTAKVRVVNATGDDLKTGTLTLRLPYGWYYDRETAKVSALDKGETSEEFVFRIHAPAWCATPNLRPINFIYETKDGKKSMPTVQMVWWGEAGK